MTTTYFIKHYDPQAHFVQDITGFITLDLTKTENSAGVLNLTLPPTYAFPDFAKDSQLYVYRSVDGLPPRVLLTTWFFIRKAAYSIAANGKSQILIQAFDATSLLARRTVAQYAGTAGASKSGAVESVMKAFVTDNFLSRAPITSLAVQTDSAQGASVTVAASNRNVLQTLQDIANASAQAGSYVSFDIVSTGVNTLEFRTYFTQRGTNRSASSLKPVFVGIQNKNLVNASLTYDNTNEINVVYAAGQGEGGDRLTATATNSAAQTSSPYAQTEMYLNSTAQTTVTQITTDANAALRANRSKTLFEGDAQQTASFRFGVEYDFGDIVTVQFLGQWFDCRINSVSVKVDQGRETIGSKLRSTT